MCTVVVVGCPTAVGVRRGAVVVCSAAVVVCRTAVVACTAVVVVCSAVVVVRRGGGSCVLVGSRARRAVSTSARPLVLGAASLTS